MRKPYSDHLVRYSGVVVILSVLFTMPQAGKEVESTLFPLVVLLLVVVSYIVVLWQWASLKNSIFQWTVYIFRFGWITFVLYSFYQFNTDNLGGCRSMYRDRGTYIFVWVKWFCFKCFHFTLQNGRECKKGENEWII